MYSRKQARKLVNNISVIDNKKVNKIVNNSKSYYTYKCEKVGKPTMYTNMLDIVKEYAHNGYTITAQVNYY